MLFQFRLSHPFIVLLSSIDLFGTCFYQVAVDSLNGSRGGGKDASLFCCFHGVTCQAGPQRREGQAGGYPCENALKAITTFGLDSCLIILVVPPVIFSYELLFINTGVWGRKPCSPQPTNYLFAGLPPHQSVALLFMSYPRLEKHFRGWKLLASIVAVSPPRFYVI